MKILIKFKIIIMCFLLQGCYPCKFLDWNCNELDPILSKNIDKCQYNQRNIAKTILKDKYSYKTQDHIGNECIKNTSYKFELDVTFIHD